MMDNYDLKKELLSEAKLDATYVVDTLINQYRGKIIDLGFRIKENESFDLCTTVDEEYKAEYEAGVEVLRKFKKLISHVSIEDIDLLLQMFDAFNDAPCAEEHPTTTISLYDNPIVDNSEGGIDTCLT